MWQFFKFFHYPWTSLSNPFQPKSLFHSNPIIFKQNLCKIFSRCVSNTIFIFYFWIMQILCLGFWKLGISENWVGFSNFCENVINLLIGLSPIWCLCIYAGPLWHFKVVLRHFSNYSCTLHNSYALLHDGCLSKCPSDILVLNWTQVSSNDSFFCLV